MWLEMQENHKEQAELAPPAALHLSLKLNRLITVKRTRGAERLLYSSYHKGKVLTEKYLKSYDI